MVKIGNLKLGKDVKSMKHDIERECQCGKCKGELQYEFRGNSVSSGWIIVCDNCKTDDSKE